MANIEDKNEGCVPGSARTMKNGRETAAESASAKASTGMAMQSANSENAPKSQGMNKNFCKRVKKDI